MIDVRKPIVDELARQLRLRDMGGIIVVDFIDMNEAENRQKLYIAPYEKERVEKVKERITDALEKTLSVDSNFFVPYLTARSAMTRVPAILLRTA